MPLPSLGPPLEASTLEGAIAAVRERGLRVSAARRLVLEMLFAAGEPLSAEQIAGGVAGRVPRSDLASVYRNLEVLEELGLVRHFHIGHGPALYAIAGRDHPDYLLCGACHRLQAVEPRDLEPVRSLIRERFAFEASFTHFPILGLCARCAREAAR